MNPTNDNSNPDGNTPTPHPSFNPPEQPQVPTVQPETHVPPVQPQTSVVQPQYSTMNQEPHQSSKPLVKKIPLLVVGVIILVVLVLSSAAAYFGYYVPNKPENIWKSALSNTSKGYDKLVDYEEEQGEIKGADIKGNMSLSGGGISGDANIDVSFFDNQGQGTMDLGFAGSRYEAEALAISVENADVPDVYLKLKGIRGLGSQFGAMGLSETIDALDEQWIFIDHTLIDQATKNIMGEYQETNSKAEITKEEMIEIARKVGEVNNQYLLSADDSTAVFVVAEEIGKEDYEGRESFRYKVKINKDNLKTYFDTLRFELKETKAAELLGEKYDETFDEIIKELDSETEKEATADVWVDMKTKTVRNVRITEHDNKDEFVDISLLYDGGDSYPIRIKMITEEGDGELKITLDTEDDSVEFRFDFRGKRTGAEMDLTGALKVSPRNTAVEVEKPSGAKTLTEIMGSFSSNTNIYEDSVNRSISPTQLGENLLNDFGL